MCFALFWTDRKNMANPAVKMNIGGLQIPISFGCQTIQILGSIDTKNLTVDPVGYDAELVLREAGERFINHKRMVNLLTVSIKFHQTSSRVLTLCKNCLRKTAQHLSWYHLGRLFFLLIGEN